MTPPVDVRADGANGTDPDAARRRVDALVVERRRRYERLRPDAADPGGYPVLAALVPVATERGGEVAYPGDPMCLYAALGQTIARSVARRARGWGGTPTLDDVYPDWGAYPDLSYRLAHSGPRRARDQDLGVTDGHVADPRIWDATAEAELRILLRRLRPRIVLLSAVSAAHRYVFEIGRVAKEEVPGCLVVLGGRHADETITVAPDGRLSLDWSSTVSVTADGRAPRVVDFVISGDGGPCLDLLVQAIGLAPAPDGGGPDIDSIMRTADLLDLAADRGTGPGVLVGLAPDRPSYLPLRGAPAERADLPSPYLPFPVRARFGVFDDPDADPRGRRTAHLMTADTCPFGCTFCSESGKVGGPAQRLRVEETAHAVDALRQLAEWGAEAAFFDDPVFWSGNWGAIERFADELVRARSSSDPAGRFARLHWGAQLTVDVVLNAAARPRIARALDAMRRSGCTYIYVGIESMTEEVMSGVAKNLSRRNPQPWVEKVHAALSVLTEAGLRVGSSVLFGLDGETPDTVRRTIEEVGRLVDAGLLVIASPNILTYHPATAITRQHGRDRLDYHSRKSNRPPYIYFEEAYPEVVSNFLTEADIWLIHEECARRWGAVRNNALEEV